MNPSCPNRSRSCTPEASEKLPTTTGEALNIAAGGDCNSAGSVSTSQQGVSTMPCAEILSHPLQTVSINSLCQPCQADRDKRIERLDKCVSNDSARRISARTTERNERSFEHGRRIYRSPTPLPMKMEASAKLNVQKVRKATNSDGSELDNAKTPRTAVPESASASVFRGWIYQDKTESHQRESGLSSPSTSISSSHYAHVSSPVTRLSFAAFAAPSDSCAVETR